MFLSMIVSLAASCTTVAGNFCDVAQGPIQFDNANSVQVLLEAGERPNLVMIDANNRTGERLCGWEVK